MATLAPLNALKRRSFGGHMSFTESVRNCLGNYANFNGRAGRPQYWWFFLFYVILAVLASIIDTVVGLGVLGFIVFLALIVPSLAVGSRRLHDTGKSGWLQLLGLIPCVGIIILIVLFVQPGNPAENTYGPPPLDGQGDLR
jgi:uncharacterized membrane protein YhaH (DUF805 family)